MSGLSVVARFFRLKLIHEELATPTLRDDFLEEAANRSPTLEEYEWAYSQDSTDVLTRTSSRLWWSFRK